jgi:hypothetical protein
MMDQVRDAEEALDSPSPTQCLPRVQCHILTTATPFPFLYLLSFLPILSARSKTAPSLIYCFPPEQKQSSPSA